MILAGVLNTKHLYISALSAAADTVREHSTASVVGPHGLRPCPSFAHEGAMFCLVVLPVQHPAADQAWGSPTLRRQDHERPALVRIVPILLKHSVGGYSLNMPKNCFAALSATTGEGFSAFEHAVRRAVATNQQPHENHRIGVGREQLRGEFKRFSRHIVDDATDGLAHVNPVAEELHDPTWQVIDQRKLAR